MRLSTGTALVASSLFSFVSAQGPYQYYLSYNTPAGEEITGLAGRFDIPRLLQAGGLFLWPGLEASDTSGELHAKLNGTTGSWTLSSDWCGDPSKSYELHLLDVMRLTSQKLSHLVQIFLPPRANRSFST